MIKKKSRAQVRAKKHMRMRAHLKGTAEKPRLAVFRSDKHMYAQIIDDTEGKTLASASTLSSPVPLLTQVSPWYWIASCH